MQKPAMGDAQTCQLSTPAVEAGCSKVQSILGDIVNPKLAKVSRDLVAKTNKTEVERKMGAELASTMHSLAGSISLCGLRKRWTKTEAGETGLSGLR